MKWTCLRSFKFYFAVRSRKLERKGNICATQEPRWATPSSQLLSLKVMSTPPSLRHTSWRPGGPEWPGMDTGLLFLMWEKAVGSGETLGSSSATHWVTPLGSASSCVKWGYCECTRLFVSSFLLPSQQENYTFLLTDGWPVVHSCPDSQT